MIVDANVWVSAVVRRDIFHQRSRLWIRSQSHSLGSMVVPSLAVVEVAGSVSRIQISPMRGQRVAQWMLRSPNVQVIPLTEALIERAVEVAAIRQIRGADAVYVAVADELGLPLVTWDGELQQRAASIVNVIQP